LNQAIQHTFTACCEHVTIQNWCRTYRYLCSLVQVLKVEHLVSLHSSSFWNEMDSNNTHHYY